MHRRLLIVIPLAAAGAAWLWFIVLPWPLLVRWFEPGRTAFMQMRVRQATANGERLDLQYTWVPLERTARSLRRAVIVAEDGRFYEHGGVDWQALRQELRYRGDNEFSWFDADDLRALANSLSYYWTNRARIRGRSTITQQLAKNLYFTSDRSVLRKLEEFIVAIRLEWILPKDRILELYLNVAEWGPGVFGAEAAARHYFGRSAANLSADQAASLAATLPHPLTSNPNLRPGRMAWRKRIILRLMGVEGPVPTVPLLPPGLDSLQIDTAIIDTLRIDTIRIDTARIDTIAGDTLRRDTTVRRDTIVRRDTTVRRDTISMDRAGAGPIPPDSHGDSPHDGLLDGVRRGRPQHQQLSRVRRALGWRRAQRKDNVTVERREDRCDAPRQRGDRHACQDLESGGVERRVRRNDSKRGIHRASPR
jgi:monofunctional biosynthetic peptidoglycan transglycosylase